MSKAEYYFNLFKDKGSEIDIGEHMESLRSYASLSDSVTELGVRGIVSTWAFVLGNPKTITSIDLFHPKYYSDKYGMPYLYDDLVSETSRMGIDFKFIQANDLEIEIKEVDLLFIDTDHTYPQLSKELELHGDKARRWIIMHDTTAFPELNKAIYEYIEKTQLWEIKDKYHNNNGLTIMERKERDE